MSVTMAETNRISPAIDFSVIRTEVWFALVAALLAAGAFLAPPMVFIVDGGIYYEMARAMAEDGALHIGDNGGIEGAPPLTKFLTHGRDGLVYPQYPSGYAFVAAPLYKVFGLHGLMLINALSAALSLWLTYALALRFFTKCIAIYAAVIFGAATFAANYALGVWPHTLALAIWLGAAWLAVAAVDAEKEMHRTILIALSGLLVGLGVNIRVDLILTAPAIFLWLRIFSAPYHKRLAVIFLASLIPGLAVAGYLNELKFGVFSPFYYGPKEGPVDANAYLWMAPALIGAVAALLLIDAYKIGRAIWEKLGAANIIASAVIAFMCAVLLLEAFRDALYGVYVLVFNLQGYNAPLVQEGVEPNEYGQLMFWGFPKRALIQSLPFLPLIALPIFDFLRGRSVSAVSLCLLCIAAPIAFYALNQWHGGGSYNMRYFIPALPFIAILSAVTLTRLIDAAEGVTRQQVLTYLVAAAGVFVLMTIIGQTWPALYAPSALYPQWFVAAVLLAALGDFVWKAEAKKYARIALGIALVAIAYGGAINFMDEVSHEKARAEQLAFARDIDGAISHPGALVVSQMPVLLLNVEANGANILVATDDNIAATRQTINAYRAAARCVYLHNSRVRTLLAPAMPTNSFTRGPYWATSAKNPEDPRLAFFGLTSQQDTCSF